MAKRKRKMTLFDVINSGQPIGIQVRPRVPTYQPTPELPVQKKLARLFGRKPANGRDPNQPLSAAEELELLRRELGAKPSPPESIESAQEPVAEADPTEAHAEPELPRSPRRATEIARDLSELPPAAPKTPRKPVRVLLHEAWQVAAPHLQSMKSKLYEWGHIGFTRTRARIESLRDINARHAATAATVLGGIIVLGGSFYVGKLLLQRPTTDPALVDADGINTLPRPDVLEIDPNGNSAVANVSRSVPDVALERVATQPQVAAPVGGRPDVFGGRNLDANYVIVQSYYTQAEADAAVDVLAKYNIRTNVEKNLPGWSSGGRDFFSVVSYDGYPRLKDNAAYQAFLQTLTKISDRETGTTLPKRLDPRPYKYVRSAQ